MKKELFKVQNMLSATAILTLFSVASFAQDADISKIEEFENKEVKIDNTFVTKPRPRVESIAKDIQTAGIKDLKIEIEEQKLELKRAEAKVASTLKAEGIKKLETEIEVKELELKREKVKPIANLEPAGIKKIEAEIEVKELELKRQRVESAITLKAEDIKKLKTNIEVKELELKREEAKVLSTLKPEGIKDLKTKRDKVEAIAEIKPEGIKEIKVENEISTELIVNEEQEEEETLSREQYLENYICQKENQLEKLEEKFTSFQKTITESTLAMQNAIAQITMLNQNYQNQGSYQMYNVPSLTDRYSSMYPMMMMQSMQNQMMIQNMSSNFTQSMNQMMMASMYGYSNMGNSINNLSNLSNMNMPQTKGTGQQPDAYTSNHNNLNNVQETFNPNRTMAVTKDSSAQQIQPWAQFTKASQDGFQFDATKANPATGDKVTETVTTPANTAVTTDEFGSKVN